MTNYLGLGIISVFNSNFQNKHHYRRKLSAVGEEIAVEINKCYYYTIAGSQFERSRSNDTSSGLFLVDESLWQT